MRGTINCTERNLGEAGGISRFNDAEPREGARPIQQKRPETTATQGVI
jgi:hypothetical protein